MQTLWRDLRYGLRLSAKSPGFAAVAVLTLALGIGANTAIFSFINVAILNGLPYRNADRLVIINEDLPKTESTAVSWPDFLDWRAQNRAFEEMAAFSFEKFTLFGAGEPVVLPIEFVSPAYFSMLGVKPYIGRLLDESDQEGWADKVVVSYSLWRSKLHGDPAIAGKAINLDGYPTTVVGVLPPDFHDFAGRAEFYGPNGWMSRVAGYMNRANHPGIWVLARLPRSVPLSTAQTEMDTIMARLGRHYPKSDASERAVVKPLFQVYLGKLNSILLMLLTIAGFVLVLACANVANLLMARADVRRKEFGLRAALGASRARLIRQLLLESMVLGLMGAGLALLFAMAAERFFVRLQPSILPNGSAQFLSAVILVFSLGVALLTTLLFGLAPSWQASRVDLDRCLKGSDLDAGGLISRRSLRSALVGLEFMIALVVAVSSALMIRSLAATLAVNPEFRGKNVLALDIQIPGSKNNGPVATANFVSEILDRIRHIPGVRSAGVAMNPPLLGTDWTSPYLSVGRPAPPDTEWPKTALNMVSPGYFQTIGTPLLAGRWFTDLDGPDSSAVAIVNQTMARQLVGDGNAVGKELRVKNAAHPLVEVVGVVPDIKQFGLDRPNLPEVFVPFVQMPVSWMTIMVRTQGDPVSFTRQVTAAIHSVNKDQPISRIAPLSASIASSLREREVLTWLLGAFGTLALVLAAVGAYGVVAYTVSQRRNEIGIRMALGAQGSDVVRLIVRQAVLPAFLGILLGIGVACGLTWLLRTILFGVKPLDFASFAGVALLLIVVALLAGYIPARRAMRVDPMVALRYE